MGSKTANTMKRIGLASIIMVLVLAGNSFSEEAVTNRQILEKLNDIEVNIARLEEGQKSLQKQIDVLKEFMLWGFGITFAGMFALIGFVVWDRRTALAPAVKKVEALEEREKIVERILKEFALKEPKLAAVMKNVAL